MAVAYEILKFGTMGLGLALALNTYRLLRQEQKVDSVRHRMIKAIYVYMGFALVLVLLSGGLEIYTLNLNNEANNVRRPYQKILTSIRQSLDQKVNSELCNPRTRLSIRKATNNIVRNIKMAEEKGLIGRDLMVLRTCPVSN